MSFWFSKLQRRQRDRTETFKCGCRWHIAFKGRQAFEKGLTPVDCPHPLDSEEQRAWYSGWIAGFDWRFPL